ncbi:YqzL family protein [Thalassobacillus sp. CUG 92003]
MIDFSWKVFSQTGNIESYLLMKELQLIQQDDSEEGIDTASLLENDRQI